MNLNQSAMVNVPQFFRLQTKKGFTMVETLVALAVLGIFFAAIALILQNILTNIGHSRLRGTALALGQSKMEIIRNLPYADVGTVGGIPPGVLEQTENVEINEQQFSVTTSVVYIDDPFDGVAPTDTINTDYKRTRIEVTWGGAYPSRVPVSLVTNIVPQGVESLSGGGSLFIHVFNALAAPVANATVTIDNTAVVPEIHMQTLTDTNGLVILPGSPACVECYQVTVTKSGYSTDRTYSDSEVTNPLPPHITVIEGELSQISFSIDLVARLTVNTFGSRESGYPPVGNVLFTIRGSKIIGYDSSDEPILKYENATQTIGNTLMVSNLEWDTYTLDFTNSAHNLAGSNPIQPVTILANTHLTVNLVAVPKSVHSLLVVVNTRDQEPLASAVAELSNTAFSYSASESTGATGAADFGQAYFGSLTSGNYDLKVILSAYEDATTSLTISGNTQETVILNPIP